MTKENPIGRVVSVSGAQIVCLLDGDKTSVDGVTCSLEVGAMVTIPTPRATVFGLARGVSIPIPSAQGADDEMQIAEIDLVGEILNQDGAPGYFQRGISVFPTLGNIIYPTTQDELRQVHALPSIATAHIGTLYHDRTLLAHIKTDDLLAKHFAVLGTTGTGKSCAVTVILKAILREHWPMSQINIHVDPCDGSCKPPCLSGCLLSESDRKTLHTAWENRKKA